MRIVFQKVIKSINHCHFFNGVCECVCEFENKQFYIIERDERKWTKVKEKQKDIFVIESNLTRIKCLRHFDETMRTSFIQYDLNFYGFIFNQIR